MKPSTVVDNANAAIWPAPSAGGKFRAASSAAICFPATGRLRMYWLMFMITAAAKPPFKTPPMLIWPMLVKDTLGPDDLSLRRLRIRRRDERAAQERPRRGARAAACEGARPAVGEGRRDRQPRTASRRGLGRRHARRFRSRSCILHLAGANRAWRQRRQPALRPDR